MKKKMLVMLGAAVLCLGTTTSVFAANVSSGYGYGYGCGMYGAGMYGAGDSLMWDEDGNFLDQDAFEANLDSFIEDGIILEEDRDYYLERYEWCLANGSGLTGMRSRGCGMGRRGGRGW